jgi:alpha-tubulin suppressor-like RCC1 family protein
MGDYLPQLSLSSTQAITAFDVGAGIACAVLDNATLKCFGFNIAGNLGVPLTIRSLGDQNDMGDALPTVNLGTNVAVRSVSVARYHVCAIVNSGQVKCWGRNEFGQLGLANGNINDIGDDAGEMGDSLPYVNLGSGRTATSISVGSNHTCAVLDNNTLKCWGRNEYGQLGQGTVTHRGANVDDMGDALAPVNLGTTATISRVTVGDLHTCVMFVDYTVRCFGRGGEGQLGYGDALNRGSSSADMGSALPSYSVETIFVPTATHTATKTVSPSRTKSPTKTLIPSRTSTATRSATRTRSLTPTKTATLTASVTRTKSPTLTPSVTRTKSLTPTKSPTRSKTLTRTRTPTRRP